MRRFAQHFLINSHAIDRIVDSLELSPQSSVLEVGPGKGALTALLVARAGHVIAVEVDDELIPSLKSRFARAKNFQLIHDDILKFDLNQLDAAVTKVVGNLPYNLTSPILRKLSEWKGWNEAIIMVQKEVGDRLKAKVGSESYGALSVGMSLTADIQPLFDLVPTSFKPPPRVHSSVLRLVRRAVPLAPDVDATQRVIQAAFQQRRKTILNSLSHGLNLDKPMVSKVLADLSIDVKTRPEQIDVASFVKLTRELKINPLKVNPA